jgi:protein-disulfide isomerase
MPHIEIARLLRPFAVALLLSFPAVPAPAQGDLSAPGPDLREQAFGPTDAPVTVIEYASLTCHHCRDFHIKHWPAIRDKYVNTGKVRFIFREFPLDNFAAAGSMLARCSGDMKWYQAVDTLFKNDDRWAHADKPFEGMKAVMAETGMTSEQFDQCLSDKSLFDKIMAVHKRGKDAGVSSTPTFFINGEKSSGALTPEEFAAIVDPLLAKAQK